MFLLFLKGIVFSSVLHYILSVIIAERETLLMTAEPIVSLISGKTPVTVATTVYTQHSSSHILQSQEKKLKEFCRQTGRRIESARTQVHAVLDDSGNIVGFNRSVAQKAVWSNRRYQKVENSSIIKVSDKQFGKKIGKHLGKE